MFEWLWEMVWVRGVMGGVSGLVEVVMFKCEDVDWIGVWDDEAGARKFCCMGDMVK